VVLGGVKNLIWKEPRVHQKGKRGKLWAKSEWLAGGLESRGVVFMGMGRLKTSNHAVLYAQFLRKEKKGSKISLIKRKRQREVLIKREGVKYGK